MGRAEISQFQTQVLAASKISGPSLGRAEIPPSLPHSVPGSIKPRGGLPSFLGEREGCWGNQLATPLHNAAKMEGQSLHTRSADSNVLFPLQHDLNLRAFTINTINYVY